MRISKTAIGLGLAATLVSAAAFAGFKSGWEVSIDTVNRNASGTLGNVRNSADNTQHIGCSVSLTSSGLSSMFCSARNAAGTIVSCSSNLASFVALVQSIKQDSQVYFSWDTSGTCTYLYVAEYSYNAPKIP